MTLDTLNTKASIQAGIRAVQPGEQRRVAQTHQEVFVASAELPEPFTDPADDVPGKLQADC